LIWAEFISSNLIAVLSWFYIRGYIPTSFWFLFFFLALWVVQIQCISGIITNRIGLLIYDARHVRRLRWGVVALIGLINVSVYCIWIPAHLQISPTWIYINGIWDRIEKGMFLIIDSSLNLYFIHLVRTRLIANGLTKYKPLFKFNMAMIVFSMSLDAIIIATMSIPNGLVYIQFHPLMYILKLHIELNMASLIGKVVKASGTTGGAYHKDTELNGSIAKGRAPRMNNVLGSVQQTHQSHVHSDPSEIRNHTPGGITRMVQTSVTSRPHNVEADDRDSQSSIQHLNKPETWETGP
jgi:hypothetical protein